MRLHGISLATLPSNSEKRIAKQKLGPVRLDQWRVQDRRGFPNQQQVMNGCDATSVAYSALLYSEVMKATSTNFGNSDSTYQKTSGDTEIIFRAEFFPLRHINPASGDKDIFKKAMKLHFGLED